MFNPIKIVLFNVLKLSLRPNISVCERYKTIKIIDYDMGQGLYKHNIEIKICRSCILEKNHFWITV